MKKVIIIGATSGIGKALAIRYLQNGCMVGVTGRRGDLLKLLKEEFGEKVCMAAFDVTGDENTKHLQLLIDDLGGLDLLIYNSGFGDPSQMLSWETDKQTTLTNVNGFAEIVNYAFNYFLKKGKGQIAAVSSIASVRGSSLAPAYSASKAFISVYLEGLQIKISKMKDAGGKKLNIAITDIQPGFIKTKMAKGHGRFWVAEVDKAVTQIMDAISTKKRKVYITKRWWVIAKLMKWLPYSIYRKIG